MLSSLVVFAAIVSVNFNEEIGKIRPELHSSGFGPQICSCPKANIDAIKSMKFKAARTHDWALLNANQRVCDYFHIFPLMHLDAKNPDNYVFGPTDYLLKRTREEMGYDIFFRLGTSIEHSGPKIHFNSLIPDDFDKVAEIFAGTIRHYNKGWAKGHEWGIKYWEIWNEPDGHNNMWCLPDGDMGVGATPEEVAADFKMREEKRRNLFAKFFVTCLKRLKSEFPDVKVGGPALCSMNVEYFTALLKACKEAGVAPDFISWHHYSGNQDEIMNAISTARRLCDGFGFRDCELIIDEWHFFGEYSWDELRSAEPETLERVWSGPASHNGIDSSCFIITMLSKFQTSELDQAYYYGCRHSGAWGFMDSNKKKYKVFYGLQMFGELIQLPVICKSEGTEAVTVLATKTADNRRKGFIVTDFRGGEKEIVVNIEGIEPGRSVYAWRHDHNGNRTRLSLRILGGKLVLKKTDENSAAFLVMF